MKIWHANEAFAACEWKRGNREHRFNLSIDNDKSIVNSDADCWKISSNPQENEQEISPLPPPPPHPPPRKKIN